jgi:hypothetical protein
VGLVRRRLILTGYLYTSAIVFLVGVQADELIRKASRSKLSFSALVRATQ